MKAFGHLVSIAICAMIAQHVHAKEYEVFDVVGDSISAGVNPELGIYGWTHMLFGESHSPYAAKTQTLFSLWPGIVHRNSAVSGSKASDWAADWEGRLSAVKAGQPDLVAVLIGGNDLLAYLGTDGIYSEAEQEQYRANLTTIVTNLLDNALIPDIILVCYYDLFDGYSGNLTGSFVNYREISAAAIIGNQIIREVAAENGCYLVDGVYDAFMHHCYGGELGDAHHLAPDYVRTPMTSFDIHPVTAGHSKLYDLIYEKMEYLKSYAIPESWMAQYGLTNYSVDVAADQDLDGMETWEEYVAGTIPTNAASVLALAGRVSPSEGYVLQWDAVSNRSYSVSFSTNLLDGFQMLQTNLTGNTYTDTVHNAEEHVVYRMEVRQNQ